MRFSVGIHPTTKKQWGYPSMYESNGRGYYIKLNNKVVDELSKKGKSFFLTFFFFDFLI